MIKTIITIACSLTLFYSSQAQGVKMPQPSTKQTIKQEFGLGSVEVSYSRPNIKKRVVFGDLVPYGKVWRTGANQATTLTFTDEVTIGGKNLPAGTYGLVSIPEKSKWTLIITKQLDVTSPAAYKQENDVVRVEVPTTKTAPTETFTMQIVDVTPTSCALNIAWDKTAVTLPITTSIDAKVMASIETAMKSEKPPYFNAAMYYMEAGKDLNQALAWFDKAIEQNGKAFWVYHQKANCLAKLGKKQEAIEAANKSIELAKEQKNDDYVALNEKLLAKLK